MTSRPSGLTARPVGWSPTAAVGPRVQLPAPPESAVMSWPVPSAVMYARTWPVAGLAAVATAYRYEGLVSLGVGGLRKFRMFVLCGTMVGVPKATAFLAVVRLPDASTDTAFRARPYSVVTRTVPSAATASPRS